MLNVHSVSRSHLGLRRQNRSGRKGVQHVVIVRINDFEFEGRPYQSLSAIARHITGTRWNGWTFFGLRARGDA